MGRKKGASAAGMSVMAIGDLVIDKVSMKETPQNGSWLYCFTSWAAQATNQFHVADNKYSGEATIDMGLRLQQVPINGLVTFLMRLDDDEADVCHDDAEDRTLGSFTASASGQQYFEPKGDWKFTVFWHMENVHETR